MSKFIYKISAAAMLLSIISCSSQAPEYKVPSVDIPAEFKETYGKWEVAKPNDHAKRGEWWKKFNDPILNDLLTKANSNNFQIKAAAERYKNAKAFLSVNNASLYPQITANGQASQNRQSDLRPLRGANQPDYYDNNFVSMSLNYELDLWGRVQSNIDSASALSDAANLDLESVRLLIQADVATNYISLRAVESQLEILKRDTDLYQKQANLMKRRFDMGISSGVDFYRLQSLVESNRIQEKNLETQRAKYEHLIALLLGESPSKFTLPEGKFANLSAPPIQIQIPSTLLQRRPDIASAERRVAATNADIGIAKTAFFPVLSLGAMFGYQTSNQANLVGASNSFWTLGPLAFLTVFDGGRRAALVDQATARNAENVALYKNTVLSAFKEVEDILVEIRNREDSLEHIKNNLTYSNKTYSIATAKYKEGIANYLEIADAAIEKSKAETAEIDMQSKLLINKVLLIKSLSGYWE